MKKKYLILIATFFCAVLVLLYGFWFVYKKTVTSMAVLTVLIVLMCIMYSYCARKTTFPEGYSLIQAFLFYRQCIKIGASPSDTTEKNIELLRRIAKENGVSNDLDEKALQKMFHTGKDAEAFIRPRKKFEK